MSDEYVNAYTDATGKSVVLLRRDGDRVVRKLVPAEYVVYMKAEEVGGDLRRQLWGSQYVSEFAVEGDWLRVGLKDVQIRESLCGTRRFPSKTSSPFADISTFEGDIDPVRRFMTDKAARIQKPRRCYIDIETDSRVPFSRKEDMRVLSWAITDDACSSKTGLLAADEDRAEEDLLGAMWKHLERYDQILAWNGDNFDFPVMWHRSQGLRVLFRRWLYLDHLALFKRMNTAAESGDEKRSMRLNDIALHVLGEGKDNFDGSKTWEAWAAGGAERERMLRYNVKDTDLLRRIEKERGYAALFDTLAEVSGAFPDTKGLNPTAQMDGYMLRLGKERGIHFPTKKFRETPEQFKGAFVMEPKTRGIARDVHVADFASLYPSIILSWNMSPETKRAVPVNGPIPPGHARSPLTGQGFDAVADSLLPSALRQLLDLRKEWTAKKAAFPPGTHEWHDADCRSTAYKVAANSFYGVVGSPFSRYFDSDIAEAVTQCGVWLIKKTIAAAEAKGFSVVYGDTDSVFVMGCSRTQFEEFVRQCNADLYPDLLEQVGCAKNEVKLAYEKQFERIVFTSAKRYCGKYAHYKGKAATKDSKPEIKGLEYKRGDTSVLAAKLQSGVIDLLMAGEEGIDKHRTLLDDMLSHALHDPLPREEVVLSKSLSKPLKEYTVKVKKDGGAAAEPPHVQVARVLKKRGQEVGEGTRIEFVVVDGTPGKPNVVIPAADLEGAQPDRYYLWESLIYPPTQRLLQAAFPDVDWGTGYEKVRPPKLRAGKRPLEAQLGLASLGAAPAAMCSEVVVEDRLGEVFLEALKALFARYPGTGKIALRLRLHGLGEAILDVSGVGAIPASEIEQLRFWHSAALDAQEAACAG